MNLEKEYYGMVVRIIEKNEQKFGFIFCPSVQMQGYEPELFFHFSRIIRSDLMKLQNEFHQASYLNVRHGTIMKFKLSYSVKHPGKLAATDLQIIPFHEKLRAIFELGKISSIEKLNKAKKIIKTAYNFNEQELDAINLAKQIAFDNAFPEFKLKLWVARLTNIFDFEEYKRYAFILDKTELKFFKGYSKKHFEIKRNELKEFPPSSLIEQKENGLKVLEINWANIGFLDKRIMIVDDLGERLFVGWEESRTSFNLVVGYIQKKNLENIIAEVLNGKIVKISGLAQLKDAILVIQKKRLKKKYDDLVKRGHNPSEDTEFRELTNKELSDIFGKHEFIEYLQEFQSTSFDMRLVYYDNSYLFSIPLNKDSVGIIWESIDMDRATYVFKCSSDEYFQIFAQIESYLKDEIINKRAKLIGRGYNSAEIQSDFKFLKSIKHIEYNFEKWKSSLLNVFPELEELEVRIKNEK